MAAETIVRSTPRLRLKIPNGRCGNGTKCVARFACVAVFDMTALWSRANRDESQTKRAASYPTARSSHASPIALVHRVGDVAQHVADLATDSAHRGNGGNRDQRGNQHVLDGSGAILVLHQLTENGQHLSLQNK